MLSKQFAKSGKMVKQKQAYCYTLMAVLLWSTVASAFKISLRYLDCLQLLFYSSLVSTIILYLLVLLQHKAHLLCQLSRQDWLRSSVMGFLNPFLFYIVLFQAYKILPAQQAQPLNYTWPIMLVILSALLLHQKISVLSYVALGISFVGVVIIATQANLHNLVMSSLVGVLIALASAVIWAFYWILNAQDERDETVKLFLNFAFGLMYILVFTLLFSEVLFSNFKGLVAATYVGLFEMGITFFIWSKALRLSTNTAQISNYIFLVPFLSLFWIYLLVGEKILLTTVIGLVLIITGILLQSRSIKTVRC